MIARLRQWVRAAMVFVLVSIVHVYRVVLRPLFPSVCRFYPSCSEYFLQAVHKYGPWRGACKGVWRLCRCNPFHPGGYDPP